MAVVLFIIAGFLGGGAYTLIKQGADQVQASVSWPSWRRSRRPAAWPG